MFTFAISDFMMPGSNSGSFLRYELLKRVNYTRGLSSEITIMMNKRNSLLKKCLFDILTLTHIYLLKRTVDALALVPVN